MFKGVECQLEFNKLLERTAELAKSPAGKQAVLKIAPSVEEEEVRKRLGITFSLARLISEGENPVESFPDISPALEKLKVEGAVLSGEELLRILRVMECSGTAKRKLKGFAHFFGRLHTFKEETEVLKKTVGRGGEILDSATAKLRSVRKEILETAFRVRKKLEEVAGRHPELCPDRIVTERNGRYVLLVKPHFLNRFKAIVHDRSSTGQSLYVEPTFVLEDNNRLRELKLEEKEEVKRILRETTEMVARVKDRLKESFEALVELDAFCAVARMSLKLKGTLPEFSDAVELKQARHPILVLTLKEVVPVDIKVERGLVITGPNAGGKTVALKTVGLLSVMAQAGFLIPTQEGSRLKLFKKWMVDIGDEQSIERSLSTFSAHIRNLAEILSGADADTLVLLDEPGGGTDPVEGSAIAVGVLKYLGKLNAVTVATTHLARVKLFAYRDPYYRVASVMFDEETLKPLYRLAYGVIGRSHALAIASKYRMPDEVLATARSVMTGEEKAVEDVIRALNAEYRRLAEERERVERLRAELERKEEELERKVKEFEKKALRELANFIAELKRKSLEALRERDRRRIDHLLSTAREKLERITASRKVPVEPGSTARVLGSERTGKVVKVDRERQTATLLVGNIKMEVKLSHLEVVNLKEERLKEGDVSVQKPKKFSPDLKLIGMRGDDALKELEKFLDRASRAGFKEVRVIHGHGEGILKKLVREYLSECPYAESFRPGRFEEGGDGVTVVKLR